MTVPPDPVRWAYCVTTHVSRRDDLLPRTLASLAAAGFQRPRLFLDGGVWRDAAGYDRFGLPVTVRGPDPVRVWGNWYLSLAETYVRDPHADRYAVFQDDLVASLGLREYLDATTTHLNSYWNLYTWPSNARLAGRDDGWFRSNQLGKGALGLVFTRDVVTTVLGHPEILAHPRNPSRGWRAADGAVVDAMKAVGITEMCHSPSLVQHTGAVSTFQTREHPVSPTFRGEDFDLRTLLN